MAEYKGWGSTRHLAASVSALQLGFGELQGVLSTVACESLLGLLEAEIPK